MSASTKPDVQDFELKYADTVLIVHVYVHADQNIRKLQKNVIRAAKGARLDAIAAWTEIHPPGRARPADKLNGEQRAKLDDFLRSATRDVVVFHLCINTDADPKRLGDNIQRAARGPRFDGVSIAIEHYDGDNGRKIWGMIQGIVTKASADPKAVPFSLDDTEGREAT